MWVHVPVIASQGAPAYGQEWPTLSLSPTIIESDADVDMLDRSPA